MKNNYFDKHGFVHDKPCINGEPSSGNSKIYTAYLAKITIPSGKTPIMGTLIDHEIITCFRKKIRITYKETNQNLSRDEYIGMIYLFDLLADKAIEEDFWMCEDKPKFNLIEFFKQLIPHIKNRKLRNYWWQNNLDQMKFLTMKLNLSDRAFVYRIAKRKIPLIYRLIEWFDKKLKPSSRSSAAIRSFKYGIDNHQGILDYFQQPDHPIRIAILEKRK
jgi:hypothetical protein